MIENQTEIKLTKYLTPLNAWALSFGCIVGWGSFMMPGTTFLPIAGPVGTAIGMALGALAVFIIAANYHFLMNRYPECGGAFSYVKKIFGYDHAFLCAWFLVITYVSVIWSNSTALTLIGRQIFGGLFNFGIHYRIFNCDVYLTEVAVSVAAVVIFTAACIYKNIAAKLVSIMAVFMIIAVMFVFGQAFNSVDTEIYRPLFAEDNNPIIQVLEIMMLVPFAFVGFESISNSAREFNFSVKKSFTLMSFAIFAGLLFYILLTELAVTAADNDYYNWTYLIADLPYLRGLASLPAVYAAFKFLGNNGIYIFAAVTFCTLSTSLIGFITASSRLICAMAEDKILPHKLAKIDNGTPKNALLFLIAVSVLIPFIGRTAVGWCVDITSLGVDIAYGYTSAAAYKLARDENLGKIKITGIIGMALSFIFGMFLLLPNLLSINTMAAESYFIMVIWGILGFVFFRRVLEFDTENNFGKSVVVWIVILFLIFFGSAMWMKQSNNESMERAIGNVSSFYATELRMNGFMETEPYRERESKILNDNMDHIRDSLMDHNIIQMVLILISLAIMFNIYSTMRSREETARIDKLKAEESSRAKTVFLSNMSHDIRTPMNAIIGYIELSKKVSTQCEVCPKRGQCAEDVPRQLREFLNKIGSSSEHLLALINDVLEMSRIESGKMELDPVDTNICKKIDEVHDMFITQMQIKNIDFRVDTANVQNKFVLCDGNRLNRILLNLLSNAYKFTPEGGTVTVTLTQTGVDENSEFGDYELRVKDTGIGMTPEFAAKVFEAFERERTSTVSGIQGTGLGMAITKSIVDLMNGHIVVNSAKGKGTEFIVSLKLKLIDDIPDAQDEPKIDSAQDDEIDFEGMKILLVDDNEVNREIASMILTEFGFEVDMAVNGKEAVDKVVASNGEYKLVLMDVQMPIMNGYEATRAIRQLDNSELANIPIIAMTANAFTEDIQNAKAAGMNAHLEKPIDIPKMIETLTAILK